MFTLNCMFTLFTLNCMFIWAHHLQSGLLENRNKRSRDLNPTQIAGMELKP